MTGARERIPNLCFFDLHPGILMVDRNKVTFIDFDMETC